MTIVENEFQNVKLQNVICIPTTKIDINTNLTFSIGVDALKPKSLPKHGV